MNAFLDKMLYQEEAVMFHGRKYFFNPGYDEMTQSCRLRIEIWDENDCFVEEVFYSIEKSQGENLTRFLNAPIWDGKTFWQAEQEMIWGDW